MPTLHECCRILEVEPSASVAEIKQSYRDLARVWHPDRFTGDPRLRARAEERLREINGAYETLLRLRTNGSQESTESQGADEKARQPSRPPSAPKPGKSHLSKTAVFVIAGIVIFFSGVRRVVENNSRTTPPARPQQSVFGAPASRTTTPARPQRGAFAEAISRTTPPARPQRGAAERSPSAFDDIIPANRLRAYFTVGSMYNIPKYQLNYNIGPIAQWLVPAPHKRSTSVRLALGLLYQGDIMSRISRDFSKNNPNHGMSKPSLMILWGVVIAIVLMILLSGCSFNCDSQMNSARSKYGTPEEINRYDSGGGYHSVSYWWWSKGIKKGFTWSDDSDCKVSTFTFDPIRKPATTAQRDSIESTMKLSHIDGPACIVCP